MARFVKRVGLGTLGLLLGFGAPRLAAQTWGVTASDPVGIARSGAGVAFGQSLEAASLNPALLASIKEHASFFLAMGQELQVTQSTLQSNQRVLFGDDRNRFLPSFGTSWRLNDKVVLGLKLDEPFMRHVQMPLEATSRFQGQSFDLRTNRLEAQGSWALSPHFSLGASLGVTRIRYAASNMVRIPVPALPGQPVADTTNPALGLMELGLQQEGTKVTPSYSLGFRWALNPRWTVGGTYVGAMSTTMPLTSGLTATPAAYYGVTGYGTAIPGTSTFGSALQALTSVQSGSGKLTLPGQATLGVRQRVNQILTWEADLRYVQGSSIAVPGYPTLTGPSGTVSGTGQGTQFNSGLGASLMGELSLGKSWTMRMGLSQAHNIRQETDVDPMLGGARNFTFSGGFGYRIYGGELNFGYQFRQSQDVDTKNLDHVWSQSGPRLTGATTRIEGMGHLWSVGFKKAF
jgi:long-subunit fatty acid transport protein